MKKTLFLVVSIAAVTVSVCGQNAGSFPGVSDANLKQLQTAKRLTPLPLPTWVPDGFKIERIAMKLGTTVPIQDRSLSIIYSRKLANGKTQRFALEAGFDGLGDLMYDASKVIPSAFGKIYLVYEPFDPDEKKKLARYVLTEWFDVGKTAYHYNGMFSAKENDPSLAMISIADTEKILRSLKRF